MAFKKIIKSGEQVTEYPISEKNKKANG